jgi:diguanylate cyclase (GGDEF)-like protein
VLYLYLPADVELGKIKTNLLESMAAQVGMAIDNAKLYGETQKMALHDPLTGLANRRFMDIKLKQAISLAERYNQPLCVSLLDIDFFKKYNDSRGHDAGDKVLIMVAEEITRGIRKSDLAARFGGEEFLIILPESDMSSARKAVERMRRNIAESLEVTISGGIALYKKGSSVEEFIRMADSALYQAKENGRNRVECA